ncbi:MAG: hypothetical protein ACKVH0_20070 [Alphaproteobacteria bacterium]
MSERVTTKLKQMIAGPGLAVLPGVADALNARIVASEGFDGIYMTGAGTSATRLGMPDVGLLTMQEMVDSLTLPACRCWRTLTRVGAVR